jgi:formyl-CoA transferase
VPCGPILTADDILADPHYAARGMHERHTVHIGQSAREVTFPGVVPKLRNRPGKTKWLGPDLGEHNDEVLAATAGGES